MIALNMEYNLKLKKKGVVFIDISLAFIEEGADIMKGAVIFPMAFIDKASLVKTGSMIAPNSFIENSVIGKNTKIMPDCRITDSKIGNDCFIEKSVIEKSEIGNKNSIGPFAHIRPNTVIEDNCKIGNFVEVKNSNIGKGTKSSHLTYLGDADIGKNVNFGCGTIIVNYDGKNKHRSTILDDAFIGCNSNIISPKLIGKKSYVGAGSTVSKNVPNGSLYVERGSDKIIKDFDIDKLKKVPKKTTSTKAKATKKSDKKEKK